MDTIVNRLNRSSLRAVLAFVGLMVVLLAGPARAHAVTCSSTSATTVDIHAIQSYSTGTYISPYQTCMVTTTGVVIAVLSDGFYLENSSSGFDSDTCTSEGIYVYTPTGVPSNAVLQNQLTVTGIVQSSNSSDRAGTQIYIDAPVVGSNVVTKATGATLPSAISSSVITKAIDDGGCSSYTAGSFGQWLPFQGMRVNVPSSSSLLVTQGTGGTVTPASQTATTNGQFWAVMTTSSRPFRAAGVNVLDPAAASVPSGVATWDANPQLMLVDSTTLGGSALDASAGTKYTGSSELVGIVDYHVSSQGYTGLLLTSSSVSALSSQTGATPVAASARQSTDQLLFATLELNGLIDAETSRMTKLANGVVNYMHSPDVLAVQNATPAALNLLLTAITSAGGPGYTLTLASSADADGKVNAFLSNDAKFDGAPTAVQELATATFTNSSSTSQTLFDRSPLLMTAKIPRKGISDYKLYLVNASLLDRAALAAIATSTDARTQRAQQAEQLVTQVLEPLETAGNHVLVMGGLNSFEFSDGYVDTTGILTGNEVASGTVWLYDATYNTLSLVNSTTTATNLTAATTNPASSRYTFVENGSAEQPDHLLYTGEMSSLFALDYARIGADFPVSSTYNTSTVARATSHDGLVGYFTIPYPTTTTVTSTPNPSYYDETVTFTATVVVTDDTSGAAGKPDGTVTFSDTSGTVLGTATLSSGVATFTYSKLTVGTHTITAAYGGSETGLGYQSSSATVSQTVNKDVSTLVVATSKTPSALGEPVTFTATASSSGEVPTGTVTYYDGSTVLGTGALNNGVATLTTSTLTIGTHSIYATYGGDDTDTTATSATITQVVVANATTVTVATSKTPSYQGEAVTFTATAVGSYGTPTGTITFYDATTSTTLGTATLVAGTATYTASVSSAAITSLSVGTHVIQAIYAGNGTNDAATGSVTQVVQTNTTTLTVASSSPTIYVGKSVTFTVAAVGASGVPSGSVSILVDGVTTLAGTLTAGTSSSTASVSTSALTVGTHVIQAHYGGDGTHAAADSATIQQVVLPTYATTSTLVCTPLIAQIGSTISCTDSLAAATGQPSGTITYYDGSTALGTATVTAGSASFTLAGLAVGSHTLTAVYAENDPYLASTSNTQTVIIVSDFALTITPTSTSLYTGESATYTITVTPGTGFTLDVALACSGAPTNSTCTITPTTVTGGSGKATMTIQTQAPQQVARLERGGGGALLAGLLVLLVPKRWRKRGAWLAVLLLGLTLGAITGCGGSGTLTGGTPTGAYTVTVTGTSNISTLTITETATTTLNVKSLF